MTPVVNIRAQLLNWYNAHRRDLPWRATADQAPSAYRVWLSEIMLQQTTVAHATPYFLAFTQRWPTALDLADAEDGDVMAAWAGLGYYARARNLLACVRCVVANHGGRFPDTEEALRRLPGVGAYTAAAVSAIAFNRSANVVDGNVERVISRLFAVETPLPAAKPHLHRLAGTLVRDDRPGDWAQALMDLGAAICRPTSPLCDRCPLNADCAALAIGDPATYPRRTAKADRPHRHGVAFRILRGDQVALIRRPSKGLLGGMLGLPTTDWRATPWSPDEAVTAAPVLVRDIDWRPIGSIEHVFTHFSLTLLVYESSGETDDPSLTWTPMKQAVADTPSVFRKALGL
jgi:A/G-specific adenine glycosylase